ncbi:glycosyltransferase [Ancylomarina sp. DW003]|nr:glycosyltransferase [Ancylomarina sp. DW003]MDE5421917.1 glycosyltransferase [Ancylomarina sp. DW003]
MINKVLIIGKIPPPIGGVTIHVKRLVSGLNDENINVDYFNLVNPSFVKLIISIAKNKLVHCHSNNRHLLFFVSVLCKILSNKLIITIHGNVNSRGKWQSLSEKLALKLCYKPLVLNDQSFELAMRLNHRTEVVSSFLPPSSKESELKDHITKNVLEFKKNFKVLFSTNASSYALSPDNKEIYGILDLIKIFKKREELGLIVSDPSGQYTAMCKDCPSNVLFISEPHPFYGILKLSDCFLRTTITDGDSLSVKEALDLGTAVIASDCVSRPLGVILYETGNFEKLINKIEKFEIKERSQSAQNNGLKDLIRVYQEASY